MPGMMRPAARSERPFVFRVPRVGAAERSRSPRGRVEDLSDDELAAIGASEMEHGFKHLNAELEEQ
jgi:hypothetical protein